MQVINSNFLRRGLVGHWGYRGNGSVSTGGSCVDSSGHGYTGTCTNDTIVNNTGIVLSGAGVVNFGNIFNDIFVGSTAKFAIIFWVKGISGRGIFSKFGDGSVGGNYRQFWLDAAYKSLGFSGALTGPPYMTYYYASNILDGGWHRVAINVDFSQSAGDKVHFYIDGVNDDASYSGDISTIAAGSAHFAIGAMVGPTGAENVHFTGTVDDFLVYKRTLSTAEIKQDYYQGKWRIV